MAGETSAELTIVVRAQDAATRVILNIGKTIGKVLLAPLTTVGKAVAGIFKQFFSLKALLVGGGFIGVIRSVVDGLSTSQTKFREIFSSSTQRGINAVDDAFARLGASIRATFGNVVGDGASGIAGFLDSISDWLRDNQDKIQLFFRDLVDLVKDLALHLRALVNGRFNLANLLTGDGEGVRRGLQRQFNFDEALARYEKEVKRIFGANVKQTNPLEVLTSFTESGIDAEANRALKAWEAFTKAQGNIAGLSDDGTTDALTRGMNAAAGAMENMATQTKKAGEIVTSVDFSGISAEVAAVGENAKKAAEKVGKLTPIIEGYLEVSEFADLAAGTLTDSFEAVIRGTQKVGQAFANMVATILGELGRLLLYRSLLKLITSAFSVGSSLGGLSSIPGSTSSGAVTPDFDYPQLARASGGPVRRSGFVTVGENGPERVALPAGSHVSPSQRSGMGGGDTINVYGARDARATAREVAAEMRRNRVLRRSLA